MSAQLSRLTVEEESLMMPLLIKILQKTDETKSLFGDRIVKFMNLKKDDIGFKASMSKTRLRKMINFIREHGILPVISGSNGYYISTDKNVILEMIASLKSRRMAIEKAEYGLANMLRQLETGNKGINEILTKKIDTLWDMV